MGNNTAIQLRNDTAANWTSDNPTLAQGEMGMETDTNRIKFGDGTTAWNSLPYVDAGASFKYGLYTLSANQTSNFAVNDHIEFNTTQGSLGGLSTGSGQANGIITLLAGKTYKITGDFMFLHSAAGSTGVEIYDRTNSTYLGIANTIYSMNSTSTFSSQQTVLAIVTPTTNIDIDIRFHQVVNTSRVQASLTYLLIEEYSGY